MTYRFRPAAARDRDAVFDFCARTWPNGDYIPLVWDDWLADPSGAFIAGIDQTGAPIACAKLSLAAPGEGWIAGVRVAPDQRERGLGRALLAYLADCAWAQGLRTLRFLTETGNAPMHRVAAACGYTPRGEQHPFRYSAPAAPAALKAGRSATLSHALPTASGAQPNATPPASGAVRVARPEEAPDLWATAQATLAPDPVHWRGWMGAAATPDWLAVAIADDRVLVAADDRSLAVLAPPDPSSRVAKYGRPPEVEVAFLAATPDASLALLAAAQAWAATLGSDQVFGFLPSVAVPAAHAAGWTSRASHILYHRARPK